MSSTLLSAATAQFRADLLAEEFSELFAQSVDREALSRGEEELHDRFGGDLPYPLSLLLNLTHGKKTMRAAGGFRPQSEVLRNRCACNVPSLPGSYVRAAPARRADLRHTD